MTERKTRFYIDFACWIEDGASGDEAMKRARERLEKGELPEISGIESFPAYKCDRCGDWEEAVTDDETICYECKWKERQENGRQST